MLPGWESGYRPGPSRSGSRRSPLRHGGRWLLAVRPLPGRGLPVRPGRTAATASSHVHDRRRTRDPTADGCSRPPTGSSTARRTRAERSAARRRLQGERCGGLRYLLHSFDFNDTGREPKAGVSQASDGALLRHDGEAGSGGYGEVFRMDVAGNLTVLHRFGPYSAVASVPRHQPGRGQSGRLLRRHAARRHRHTPSYGIVYRMEQLGLDLGRPRVQRGPDGIPPHASLTLAGDDPFYGSTSVGGAFGLGTLFRLRAYLRRHRFRRCCPLTPSQYSVVGGTALSADRRAEAGRPGPEARPPVFPATLGSSSVPASVTVPARATRATFPVPTPPADQAHTRRDDHCGSTMAHG